MTIETVVDNPSFSPSSTHHSRADPYGDGADGYDDGFDDNDPDLIGLSVAGDVHRDSYLHLDDNAEQFQGFS